MFVTVTWTTNTSGYLRKSRKEMLPFKTKCLEPVSYSMTLPIFLVCVPVNKVNNLELGGTPCGSKSI